jgi:sugar phosphate permease
MTSAAAPQTVFSRRRWVVLAVGTLTQAATASFIYGIALLLPALRRDDHLSLVAASLVVSAPAFGLLLTLIAWGALADRFGERIVIASGVGLSTLFLGLAAVVHGVVVLSILLAAAGAAGASVNAASGRMVMGWFSVAERGLAMGTRQTAQPLGVAIAALSLPGLGQHFGAHRALLFPTLLCGIAAIAVVTLVRDPSRIARVDGEAPRRSPYRGSSVLWRVHAASSLLVVPQFAVATFTLVYLVGQRHWDVAVAGRMIFGFQFAGALGRIAAGIWSDLVRSRLRPMRQLALLSGGLMIALGIGAWTGGWWIVIVFGLAAVVTVADNGLAYVTVAEFAGSDWAGRALGTHNTAQNIMAIVTAPMLAIVIDHGGFGLAFFLVGLVALLAIPIIPVRAESMPVMVPAR